MSKKWRIHKNLFLYTYKVLYTILNQILFWVLIWLCSFTFRWPLNPYSGIYQGVYQNKSKYCWYIPWLICHFFFWIIPRQIPKLGLSDHPYVKNNVILRYRLKFAFTWYIPYFTLLFVNILTFYAILDFFEYFLSIFRPI